MTDTETAPETAVDLDLGEGPAKTTRKVHALDDDNNPTGPLLCGKASGEVLGPRGLKKGDVFCRKCALALMERSNDYASQVNVLSEICDEKSDTIRELRMKVLRKDRMLIKMMERYLDAEEQST